MAKVMISLPGDLLSMIDEEAKRRGWARSRFLQECAYHELGWPDPGVIDEALERGRRAAAELGGSFDSTEAIRQARDSR